MALSENLSISYQQHPTCAGSCSALKHQAERDWKQHKTPPPAPALWRYLGILPLPYKAQRAINPMLDLKKWGAKAINTVGVRQKQRGRITGSISGKIQRCTSQRTGEIPRVHTALHPTFGIAVGGWAEGFRALPPAQRNRRGFPP